MECDNKDCVSTRMQRDSLHTSYWNSHLSITRIRVENKRLRERSKVLAGALASVVWEDGEDGALNVIGQCEDAKERDEIIRLADAEVRKMGRKTK